MMMLRTLGSALMPVQVMVHPQRLVASLARFVVTPWTTPRSKANPKAHPEDLANPQTKLQTRPIHNRLPVGTTSALPHVTPFPNRRKRARIVGRVASGAALLLAVLSTAAAAQMAPPSSAAPFDLPASQAHQNLPKTLMPTPVQSTTSRRPSHCLAIAETAPGLRYLHRASVPQKASFRDPVPEFGVRISYVSHSSFLIQTPGGLTVVTDYAGYIGNVDLIPDVVTMNHAHSTHWTAFPDPAIPHVLRGWSETFGERIDHNLDLGEMLIRNVSTDIRSQRAGIEPNGNSIFVFEVSGLCIGHLGHLHHEPDDAQYAALGRLDVVMVPVDGGMTLDTASMVRVVEQLKSSIVVPMHWFSGTSLGWFLDQVQGDFAIDLRRDSELTLSLRDLPTRPTVVVLQPQYLQETE